MRIEHVRSVRIAGHSVSSAGGWGAVFYCSQSVGVALSDTETGVLTSLEYLWLRRPSCTTLVGVQGAQRLAELRHVTLTTPSKRETTIDRLPLKVSMAQDEDWQPLYEAADNPTMWYRQPLVIVVLVRPPPFDTHCHVTHTAPLW